MAPYNNLLGLKFGKLHVMQDTGKRRYQKVVWLCKCDCGKEREVVGSFLTTGKVYECKDCSKLSHQKTAYSHNIRHALKNIYYHMKDRCENPKSDAFKYYGARGIRLCKEWSESLVVFREWAVENGYTHGLSLERIDVNGNYCPENCKWIPLREQPFNRRDNIFIHFKGKKVSLARMCYDLNLDLKKIRRYIRTNIKYSELI